MLCKLQFVGTTNGTSTADIFLLSKSGSFTAYISSLLPSLQSFAIKAAVLHVVLQISALSSVYSASSLFEL